MLRLPVREKRSAPCAAFTLVELLVCLAILALIMLVVASMVGQTSSIWQRTVGRVEQFREARDGFEAITRRLSQATLNTYWDYDNANAPTKYIRQSELRFISGPGIAGSSSTTPPRPTHSIFFQAPLGFVVPTSGTDTSYRSYLGLENLLNTWGFFVEYNNDGNLRPSVLSTPTRTRFRLMEYMESSPTLSLYKLEVNTNGGNGSYTFAGTGSTATAWGWFLNGVNCFAPGNMAYTGSNAQTAPVHILAENVVALILLPKLTPAQETQVSTQAGTTVDDTSLASDYFYDSTGTSSYDPTVGAGGNHAMPIFQHPNLVPYLDPTNQLPPIVQVTMVAIDETSAIRLSASQNQGILGVLDNLFGNTTTSGAANFSPNLTGSGSNPSSGLESYLQSLRVNYREFTTDVSIKGAKWSSYQ